MRLWTALGLGVGEPMPSWGAMLLERDNSALITKPQWVHLPIALLVVVLLIPESFTTEVETLA
jgi:ABC-type dipeptide/oligopeptide/nickel transport system permease subunit